MAPLLCGGVGMWWAWAAGGLQRRRELHWTHQLSVQKGDQVLPRGHTFAFISFSCHQCSVYFLH